MDKKLISVGRRELDLFEFFQNESLTDAISKMQQFKARLDAECSEKGLSYSKIQIDQHYDYDDYYIEMHRLETDEEYQARIQKELERAEKNRIKKEKAAAVKFEKQRQSELKELEELQQLRNRVAELEKKHSII